MAHPGLQVGSSPGVTIEGELGNMRGQDTVHNDGLPTDDELDRHQLAAMQSVDDARRAGEISADDAATIETVIRRGHVHGARKRLTEARRRQRQASP